MVSFNLTVTETIDRAAPTGGFGLALAVAFAVGIPPELFVYRVADDGHDHAATPFDLDAWPPSKAQAVAAGVDYYRRATATLVFDDKATAVDARAQIQARLRFTARQWDDGLGLAFGGVTVVEIDGEA